MYTKKYLLFTFVALLTFTAFGQQSTDATLNSIPVVKPGATLVKLPQQFAFAEGPAVDKKGDIYFTDQPNDKIWKYDINGKLSLFMDKTGRANGLYFDKQQRIVACADEQNELRAITLKKKVTVLLDNFEGQKLNGPNDLWVDKKGGIYFTDPYYQRDYWQRKKPDMKGCYVYYLPKGSRKAVIVDSTLIQPNGIVGKADGKTLYVADINDNKTWRYQINADGSLSNRQLFAAQGSDGMTIDREGNIYLAGVGVTVYNAQGVKLGNIPVPSKWVGNLCFGGQRRDLLLITASESVYTLQMAVNGEE
ncbi:SMP-30/gluconolactonase/LRE family protein [Ferruginibacter paludis]|uniref:SMP-30/gluconolactonase/LRE family protein n=1 Tax=Ferruginibacter paludis TaxID=1310417 RepID=UPI0025B40224|nr:SMP-30/gluconolactonase/LRE family protein [Ferruginibacter paludis]MDN3655535.1 SMP-30/gluconolactonase/LRE family protein [Ferruginibacter paludis]